MIRFPLLFSILLVLGGCFMDAMYSHIPNAVEMEPAIYALDGLNGPYDEFNAVAGPPPLAMDAFIAFASNDASQGGHFSIDAGRIDILQNPYYKSRQKNPPLPTITARRLGAFVHIPDLPGNVRGPSALAPTATFSERYEHDFNGQPTQLLKLRRKPLPAASHGELPPGGVWMFDSDHEGRRNLYFVDSTGRMQPFLGNDPQADDAYATYNQARGELYFCSNRDGKYRIYRYRYCNLENNFSAWLADTSQAQYIEPVLELDAPGQTMAPFVYGDLMVFASDRPGGQGGFDLYLSRNNNGRWQPPVNIQKLMPPGVMVNTAGNEFRPSLLTLDFEDYHDLRVLLFSSDRPGGQGGYDLYLTALPPL